MAHIGSWTIPGTNIGLPDFGITEKISDLFGQSRNIQGGSQLRQGTVWNIGNVPYTYSTTRVQISSTTTYIPSAGGGYYKTTIPTSQPQTQIKTSGGGGGGSPDLSNKAKRDDYARQFGFPGWDEMMRAQQEAAERENRIRSAIESGYNDFIRRLDEMAGLYPQWEQEDVSALEKSKQSGIEGLETSKTSSLEKLGLAREQAYQQEQQAKADIMSQLRQLLKASQMRAGLLGAGWSSATQEVLPAVMGKQAAQAGAQVARGTISNLNQIAQKEIDVKNTFDLAKNQLEQDFNDKLTQIRDKYRQLKQWIETEKANAGLRKAQALAALDESLMNNAINEVNMLKQTYIQQQQALQNWAVQRIAQLQDYKIQMGQYGSFQPEELTYQALQGIGGLTGRVGVSPEDIFGVMVDMGKRKRELLNL